MGQSINSNNLDPICNYCAVTGLKSPILNHLSNVDLTAPHSMNYLFKSTYQLNPNIHNEFSYAAVFAQQKALVWNKLPS